MGTETLELGHTGRLRENAFVFYDRHTGATFCQADGRCATGPSSMKGRGLERLPAWILPWSVWRALYPGTRVMLPPEGTASDGAQDVYADYDRSPRIGIHPLSRLDSRLPPKVLVLGVDVDGEARCWTVRKLSKDPVMNDRVGSREVVVAWDTSGGWGTCFDRRLDGQLLAFTPGPEGSLLDDRAGRWDLAGRCVSGPSRGKRLRPIPAMVTYWFAFQAHHPATTLVP